MLMAVGLAGAAWGDAAEGSRPEADPDGRLAPIPASLEAKVQRLRADLEKRGYEVIRGDWYLYTNDDCPYAIDAVGNCYGNNPAAPYIIPILPHWQDEFVDPLMETAFSDFQSDLTPNFRFDPREAVVVLAQMPPEADYFGLQAYVYSRAGPVIRDNPIYDGIGDPDIRDLLFAESPNPGRVLHFASIGDSTNDVVVREASGAAFDVERFFVITPDKHMSQKMTAALVRAGVPHRRQVFTEPVASDLVHVGLGEEADDLVMLLRYVQPHDEVAGDAWRAALPMAVLRVRERHPHRPPHPYAFAGYESRTANPEGALEADLLALRDEVRQRWNQPEAAVAQFFNALSLARLRGDWCLGNTQNCLGDNQDTDTYRISAKGDLDHGQVLAVVGTLGTATGNATYVSLAVNLSEVLEGVDNLSQHELAGTAAGYADVLENDPGLFYVYYLARDCTGIAHCRELDLTTVPYGAPIKMMQRNYVFPGSRRGPEADPLLNPWLIFLDQAAAPHAPGR